MRLFIFGLLLVSAAVYSGCKKADLMKYESETNVYFAHTSNVDSVVYTFSKDTLSKDTMLVKVLRMGRIANDPVAFTIEADPAATTAVAGTDYVLPDQASFAFAPDSSTKTLRIAIRRSAGLRENVKRLQLVLRPNDHFQTNLQPVYLTNDTVYHNRITLVIDDILVQPAWWLNFESYLGTFSRKKVEMFADFIEALLPYKTLIASGSSYSGILRDQSRLFQQYLNQQASQGNTIYEEDGRVMVMGPSAQ